MIFKWYAVIMLALIIVAQIFGLSAPYFLAKIYDTVAGKAGEPDYWNKIIHFTIIVGLLSLGKLIFMESVTFVIARFVPKSTSLVTKDVYDYVSKHSVAYYSKEMTGNISNKVQQLTRAISEFFSYSHGIMHSFSHLFVSVLFLSLVSWYYLVVISLWMTIIVYTTMLMNKSRILLSKESAKLESATNGLIVDSLSNYSEIKSFATFRFEKLNLLKSLRIWRRADTKEHMSRGYARTIKQLISAVSIICFLFLSIYLLKIKAIDTTQFIFTNTLFMGISGAVFELSWIYNNMSRIVGRISSALEVLSVDHDIIDKPNAKKLITKKANIVFDNVSFKYDNKKNLFKKLNLEIVAGEKIGLVGESGSGKSTFIKLISRYYDIENGTIKINGNDIRDITQESLHKNIATIPQDISLFNRTIFENIKYGKTSATDKEVYQATKKAYAHNFIEEFEDKYQTKVGDRGIVLSGGEKQRIAIARAIIKNAPILIFDEATSALDSKSERHIQDSLKNLMKGKTVIAIAHRLSTLREMDRILVLDKGKIVESGTHLSLLRKKGMYYKLYTMQVDGFVGA